MKLRWCHSPTPSLLDVSEANKQDYQGIISFSTPNPTMAEATTAASSPASLPSLAALSLASTDGDDGEGVHFMSEVPANASSKSYSVTMENQYMTDSWQSILDDEEDDIEAKLSQCSSGILSAESLDMDFVEAASLHSLSSAKTLKSPSARRTTFDEANDANQQQQKLKSVGFHRVTTNDIPVQRACHGALNISPKQLANVFALFSAEREKENEPPPDAAKEEAPMEKPKPEKQQLPTIQDSCFLAPTTCPRSVQDNPFSVQQHYKSRTAHPKLTAELYWKPRAKNLEKEVEALKEILADDSCKILQLKSALETLRADKFRNVLDIQSFQEELESTKQDLENLKKEREVFLENETEYRETIRILKNEVDMLTRDGQDSSSKMKTSKEQITVLVDQEELQQLRLENQLFAAQIVDYEAELERLEQKDTSSQLKETHKNRAEGRAKDSPEVALTDDKKGLPGTKEATIDDGSIFRALSDEQAQDNKEIQLLRQESVKELVSRLPYVENVTPSMEEEGIASTSEGTPDNRGKRKTRIAVETVSDPAIDKEEMVAVQDDGASDREDCMQQLASGMPTEFPQQIIGNVLGMFAVGEDSEGNETDKKEVFVIHQAETTPTAACPDNKVPCLQWKSPDELPAFTNVNVVAPLDKAEDRNPPSSASSDAPLSIKTNLDPSVPIASSRHEVKHRGREDTEIEVLQNGDASQSIEVHLSKPDPNKKGDNKSGTSKEKCDVWNALSHCPCIVAVGSQ